MLSLWFLSALLLFTPFAGQRRAGFVLGCVIVTIDTSESKQHIFNWTDGQNGHGLNIVALVVD